MMANSDELLRQWDAWVFGVDEALTDPLSYDWTTLERLYDRLLWQLDRFLTAGDGPLSPAVLCRMESRLDRAVASLKALLVTFRLDTDSNVEWALTSYVILLQYILQRPKNSSQSDRTGPAPAYASLLKLCLVDCPALLGAVPLWATSLQLSVSAHHINDWGAGSSGELFLRRALALCRVVLDRLAQTGHLRNLRQLTTAAEWLLTCYKRVASCGSKHILGEAACHQALFTVMGAANRLLEVAVVGSVDDTESVWGVFAKDPDCRSLLAPFLLAEAAKEDAAACLASMKVPRAWDILMLLLLHPNADKAVHPGFVKVLVESHSARDSWKDLLEQLARVTYAACDGASTAGSVVVRPGLRKLSLALMSILNGCSMLHSRLLHEVKGPHAADPLAAQWAEQLGMDAAGQCLGFLEGVAGWDDEAWRHRGMMLRSCGRVLAAFLTGKTKQCEDILQPAFSMFTATSRAGQPSARIPGRQAVAAVTSAVALAEHGLRLAGRIPLPYWTGAQGVAETCVAAAGPDYQQQPWALCSTVAGVAASWLVQRLPTRPGGPAPVLLISLLEGGAVPGCFKSLLGLLATQRKVVRKWSAALSAKPGASEEHPPTMQFLQTMERLVNDATTAALGLAPRFPDQPQGRFDSHRCHESVAAVALGTALTVKHLLAHYEHRAWQQGSIACLQPYDAQSAAHLMSRLCSIPGGLHAVLSATGPLLHGPAKSGQGAAIGKDQALWMAEFSGVLGFEEAEGPPPSLLLAAVQGGMLRLIAGWAQQACQQVNEGEVQVADLLLKLLELLEVVNVRCCQELDAHMGGQGFCRLNSQLLDTFEVWRTADLDTVTDRQLAAGLRAGLTAAWQARRSELVPQMEAAAAWGTAYVVVWGSDGSSSSWCPSSRSGGEGTSGSSSCGMGSGRGSAEASEGDAVLPPESPPSLPPASAAVDVAVAAASLQPAVPGQRSSPGIYSLAAQPGSAGYTAEGASLSPTTVTPGGRDQQPGGLAQQQQQPQQDGHHRQPWTLHGSPAPPHTCPLGQVQTELALGGLLCAHPACPNFSGPTDAALRLQRCAGCRIASYCSSSCAKDDWSRHRSACNAFRRMRRGQASVKPAWNLKRQQY